MWLGKDSISYEDRRKDFLFQLHHKLVFNCNERFERLQSRVAVIIDPIDIDIDIACTQQSEEVL